MELSIRKAQEVEHWRREPAVITESEFWREDRSQFRTQSGNDSMRTRVKGVLLATGASFETRRIRADGVMTDAWLPLYRDRYKVGTQVEVLVSPADPAQIVMEPSHELGGLRRLQLAGVLLMLGAPLAWFFLRKRWTQVDAFGKPVPQVP